MSRKLTDRLAIVSSTGTQIAHPRVVLANHFAASSIGDYGAVGDCREARKQLQLDLFGEVIDASAQYGQVSGGFDRTTGFMALHYGMQTPLTILLSHIVFGLILGALPSEVGLPIKSRARARDRPQQRILGLSRIAFLSAGFAGK